MFRIMQSRRIYMRSRYIHNRILAYLSDCKLHTIKEIAEEIEVSYITVLRHIQDISEEMITTYHGGGKNRGGVQLLRTDKLNQIFDTREVGLFLEGIRGLPESAERSSLMKKLELLSDFRYKAEENRAVGR